MKMRKKLDQGVQIPDAPLDPPINYLIQQCNYAKICARFDYDAAPWRCTTVADKISVFNSV